MNACGTMNFTGGNRGQQRPRGSGFVFTEGNEENEATPLSPSFSSLPSVKNVSEEWLRSPLFPPVESIINEVSA